ncbi:MAG: hypothetical protein IPL46_33430 [Saprospiraceae bacterium]|nr:hypothetical protein [Saprospiraceae bacterium]
MTYNHLNLPTKISYSANKYLDMVYDAAGNMLSRRMVDTGLDDEIDYVAGIEFYDGVTQSIMHNEGRVFFTSPTTSRYEYVIRDHLGNARLMYTDLNNDGIVATPSEILWEGQYYPFGLAHKGAWMDTPDKEVNYKYNGIELASDFGLNVNLATFTTLDPATERWCQVDPKAELMMGYSPYNSMANNPVSFNDPDGDIIPVLVLYAIGAAVVNGTINVASQALKGNVNNFWQGLEYFGVGAAAGVAYVVPAGGVALAGTIQAGGNKVVQIANGQWSPSDIEDGWDVAEFAFDLGLDFTTPALGANLGKAFARSALIPIAESTGWLTTISSGGSVIKVGGAVDDIAFSVAFSDDIVVSASRVAASGNGAGIAAAKGGMQYTKSSLSLGRQMHTGYKAGLADGVNTFKEFTKVPGIRPDYVDFTTKTIYELKPFNPRGIQLGTKQLNNYKSLSEQKYGGTWKTVLDFY